jgi:hypothetical protein
VRSDKNYASAWAQVWTCREYLGLQSYRGEYWLHYFLTATADEKLAYQRHQEDERKKQQQQEDERLALARAEQEAREAEEKRQAELARQQELLAAGSSSAAAETSAAAPQTSSAPALPVQQQPSSEAGSREAPGTGESAGTPAAD